MLQLALQCLQVRLLRVMAHSCTVVKWYMGQGCTAGSLQLVDVGLVLSLQQAQRQLMWMANTTLPTQRCNQTAIMLLMLLVTEAIQSRRLSVLRMKIHRAANRCNCYCPALPAPLPTPAACSAAAAALLQAQIARLTVVPGGWPSAAAQTSQPLLQLQQQPAPPSAPQPTADSFRSLPASCHVHA